MRVRLIDGSRFPFGAWLAAGLLTLAALFAGADRATAIEPEQREAIVVTGRVWEGAEYREIFVPSTADEVTLMAGAENALVYTRTREYYWPLSRQVYVDFERQRDKVEGSLVIRRKGEVVAREPLRSFSILYPEGAARGQGRLLWGEDAEKAYAEHRESERRFIRDFAAAQRAHSDYERRLLESGAARVRGGPVETIEPPPPLPEPSLRLVTPPETAFRVALEPGDYAMAIEQNGQIVPETERSVRVVPQAGRETLVADVVPEERWTRPLASNIDQARIYARPGTTFYMTLSVAARFEESEYLPIVSPQASTVAGRSLWVRRKPSGAGHLQVSWDGGETHGLDRGAFKVEQTAGSSFGYRVRPALSSEPADLNAFAINVPDQGHASRGLIRLRDDQTAFSRSVVIVDDRQTVAALALAFVPFAIYLVVAGVRRRSNRIGVPL